MVLRSLVFKAKAIGTINKNKFVYANNYHATEWLRLSNFSLYVVTNNTYCNLCHILHCQESRTLWGYRTWNIQQYWFVGKMAEWLEHSIHNWGTALRVCDDLHFIIVTKSNNVTPNEDRNNIVIHTIGKGIDPHYDYMPTFSFC